jgi:hypothetical protein
VKQVVYHQSPIRRSSHQGKKKKGLANYKVSFMPRLVCTTIFTFLCVVLGLELRTYTLSHSISSFFL